MILDMFSEEDIKVVVSYLPVWEFFFSMHVLSNPEHHVSRQKWMQSKEQCLPELVKDHDVLIAPIVSSGKACKVIIKHWLKKYQRTPDFIVIEGSQAGGHLDLKKKT